jgi:hypothetical protein
MGYDFNSMISKSFNSVKKSPQIMGYDFNSMISKSFNSVKKSPLLAFIKFKPTFLTGSLAVCASLSEATISSFSLAANYSENEPVTTSPARS